MATHSRRASPSKQRGAATNFVVVLAVASAAALLCTRIAGALETFVFVAGGDRPLQPQFLAAAGVAGTTRGKTAAAATATRTRPSKKKGGKYRGAVSPKLRLFLNSKEYRKIIDLLSRLEEQGLLDDFLKRSEDYWLNINIFQLALEEKQKGGAGVLMTVRRDWARIWPESLDTERMKAFDEFADFWKRLDSSRLVDNVMTDVLPDMKMGYAEYDELMQSSDQKKLMRMSDEERKDEIMKRLGTSDMIKQYAALSFNDKEVQAIAPKMMPFIAKSVSILERKVATQTEELGNTLDYGIIAVAVVVVAAILFGTGLLKLPS